MNIVVLIKEVPDMTKVKFDRDRGVVDRAGAPAEINPFDENAIQAALNLKKTKGDITITVVTMGPLRAEKSLRMAYAKGVDKMVLVSDRAFGGSDTFATAKVLAEALKNIEDIDLIICGEKSVDGDTAQVGAEVAEFLDIPHSYYVDKIDFSEPFNGEVIVEIENISGNRQERVMKTPCLVSVSKNIAKPQLPTLQRKLESLNKEILTLTIEDIKGLDKENTGFNGSPTKVSKIVVPKETIRESIVFRDNVNEFLDKVEQVLVNEGVL